MLGTDAGPTSATVGPDAGGESMAIVVLDDRGLVCALSSNAAELGLDASPERVGRHWTELFPSFRRLPTHPGGGEDDFVVMVEPSRQAFRVTRHPLIGGEKAEGGGAFLLLRPLDEAGGDGRAGCQMATLSQVAADVAHEINNPLTTISGWVQMFLSDGKVDEAIREQFASIGEELDRISNIVDKLLAFAQKPGAEKELLNLNELVRNVVSFLEYPMRNANVAIDTELSPAVGLVEGDRSELKQVFLNLMINARQAMPEGGRLRVATQASGDGRSAEVRFSDTGHGVPREAAGRLFEPYFTTRAEEGGSGIGLALSRDIVRSMAGELELEDTSPTGTTFRIRLPLAEKE